MCLSVLRWLVRGATPTIWLGICLLGTTAGLAKDQTVVLRQVNGWQVAETAHFRCWVCNDPHAAREVALACETWLDRLRNLGATASPEIAWNPRCDVVVHPHRTAYGAALNRPGDVSVGSTRLQFDGERVVCRRIDLRSDVADWQTSALPHELTHVVLAERFHGRPLPPWADEGLAMLSESPAKQSMRLNSLRVALRQQSCYSLRELMAVRTLPPPHLRDAFYSQSFLLTAWLVERHGLEAMLRCLEASQEQSFETALQKELGLEGIAAMEQLWTQWVRSPSTPRVADWWTSPPAAMELASSAAD